MKFEEHCFDKQRVRDALRKVEPNKCECDETKQCSYCYAGQVLDALEIELGLDY